jgi:hypothetical protein
MSTEWGVYAEGRVFGFVVTGDTESAKRLLGELSTNELKTLRVDARELARLCDEELRGRK